MIARIANIAVITVLVVTVGGVLLLAQDATPSATGTWKWTSQAFGGDQETVLILKQAGESLTGTVSGFGGESTPIAEGKIKAGEITFKVVRDFGGSPITTTYTGKIDGDTFKGKSETVISQPIDAKRSK
jgi:hypothetical protein